MAVFALDALFPHAKYSHSPSGAETVATDPPFNWSEIDASEDFNFHKCYDGFECAKLSVPLDYFHDTFPQERVSIAITKLPAKVPVHDPRYAGPILLNPGGPGGSGAQFALSTGRAIQDIVDADVDMVPFKPLYYDIIGFDPRGIGWTEPAAVCMDPAASWSWALREATEGILGSSDAALGRLWSMTHAWGASCKQATDAHHGPDIKQYMSTAFVARDMVEIIEKHASWAAKRVEQPKLDKPRAHHEPQAALIRPKEAKLQYWGFSYGTYLGSTFASMFPDRVGRVVLDGVVSYYDYNHSLGNGSLTDNQKAINSFYTYCKESGPAICPLATSSSTMDDIQLRVQNISSSLYHNPLAINSAGGPDIVTYTDVQMLLFESAYLPQATFPLLAQILAAIEVGHGSVLDILKDSYRNKHVYSCSPPNSTQFDFGSSVATYAILCSDGIDVTSETVTEFTSYWKNLQAMAPTSGAIWSMLRMRCDSWPLQATHKFSGPFGGNTWHPMLFLSNTADPVTPLRSARLMHSLFPSSGLLVTDAAGHCSAPNPPPHLCLLKHTKTYFQSGSLPPKNTLCVPPQSPFSLNSTDPKSPFYDPELQHVSIDPGLPADQQSAFLLLSAGARLARSVAGAQSFGLGRVLLGGGGRGIFSKDVLETYLART
ncbi:hypothetical protein ACEQ8H_005131 [Pleosporales sp. CAS-2024a]